ncbi:hypothetical protein J3F84DRAFT_74932 [Trichoderma pleuroticola]
MRRRRRSFVCSACVNVHLLGLCVLRSSMASARLGRVKWVVRRQRMHEGCAMIDLGQIPRGAETRDDSDTMWEACRTPHTVRAQCLSLYTKLNPNPCLRVSELNDCVLLNDMSPF